MQFPGASRPHRVDLCALRMRLANTNLIQPLTYEVALLDIESFNACALEKKFEKKYN